jgi:hypothetical protein
VLVETTAKGRPSSYLEFIKVYGSVQIQEHTQNKPPSWALKATYFYDWRERLTEKYKRIQFFIRHRYDPDSKYENILSYLILFFLIFACKKIFLYILCRIFAGKVTNYIQKHALHCYFSLIQTRAELNEWVVRHALSPRAEPLPEYGREGMEALRGFYRKLADDEGMVQFHANHPSKLLLFAS